MARRNNNRSSLLLKAAFVMASSWAVVMAFIQQIEAVLTRNPVAEGTPLHALYEIFILLAILSAVSFACIAGYKRWPMFLQVHRDVSCVAVLWRGIAFAPGVFVLVGLVVFTLVWLFVVRFEDPTNAQYGLSAWWLGYYYALMLTPMITVVSVWLKLCHRHPE